MQIRVSETVRSALDNGKAVVALESTVITHGLPQPLNLETALAMQSTIERTGAVPATIAVLGGRCRVGLNRDELHRLATATGVRKCSRRDLPVAAVLGEDGGTTVATTMYLAHAAGIRVFATGGIGGVHRDSTFDVSADLVELGRTPLAVVCAGAKAILDLPATLEVLETHGVTVAGFRTNEFPAFFSRSSDLPVDVVCESVDEISRLVAARDALALSAAVLVCNPLSVEDELPASEAGDAIATALAEAAQRGVSGKAITPFLLSRVSELTGEASLRANLALLKSNAKLAGQLAVALAG